MTSFYNKMATLNLIYEGISVVLTSLKQNTIIYKRIIVVLTSIKYSVYVDVIRHSPTSGGRLIRSYTKSDLTVDERKERLNPSCNKN